MNLKLGSRGPAVEALQLALARAGFYSGRTDGIFGPQTRNAVIAFQRANSLAADGIAGPQTLNALSPYLLGYTIHTIRQGDTLYRIAASHGSSVDAIISANPGIDPLDLQVGSTITVPLSFDVVPTTISWTSVLNAYVTEGLAARYPFIRRTSIGNSVMGRPLYCLTIGSGPIRVFYNAATHANEWITTPVLLKFLEQYAKAYVSGGRIYGVPAARLMERVTLYVVPMLNPDGVDLVTGLLDSGSYYSNALAIAREYPSVTFPSGWKANINGVDLNLQFPAEWERAREIKFAQGFTSPAPRDFVGTAPLTEPESLAVYNFTRNISPALILAYHSQGEIIYWKFLDYEPPRSQEIGELMSTSSGYSLELTPTASGYAGYKDWFIQDFNRPGYTIEVGRGTSPLPLSQFDRIYSDNVGILVIGMTQASY